MNNKHIDEIKQEAKDKICKVLKIFRKCRIVIIYDIYGKLKLVVFPEKDNEPKLIKTLKEDLNDILPSDITESLWISNDKTPELDKRIYQSAWDEAEPCIEQKRLRISDRYISHGGWIYRNMEAPWEKPYSPNPASPPIIVFYSFKGGVGRTTALAAFAVQRARAGERVAVIDADLDAPGIGSLLTADQSGTTARWGVADYMLEKESGNIDYSDYYHSCRRENVTGSGEILVIPSGKMDTNYPWKLARLDMEPIPDEPRSHSFYLLLNDVKENLKPDWILIDIRAGISVPAGILIGGFAHLNVIFGTSSEQSWSGLEIIISRLGARKLMAGKIQDDLILVQSMVPRNGDLAEESKKKFAERARDVFSEYYYAESTNNDDDTWTLDDIENSDAPHNPVTIQYDEIFTTFRYIDDIADQLAASTDYMNLTNRILTYFGDDNGD